MNRAHFCRALLKDATFPAVAAWFGDCESRIALVGISGVAQELGIFSAAPSSCTMCAQVGTVEACVPGERLPSVLGPSLFGQPQSLREPRGPLAGRSGSNPGSGARPPPPHRYRRAGPAASAPPRSLLVGGRRSGRRSNSVERGTPRRSSGGRFRERRVRAEVRAKVFRGMRCPGHALVRALCELCGIGGHWKQQCEGYLGITAVRRLASGVRCWEWQSHRHQSLAPVSLNW